ncbi:hypothetical protein A2U01_0052121 [Trifolium medium]|uniref:Uncharacterized protein n=1 Tax=Trifolium medium TaxID=97028 RepID=A0A392R539_9FABA|nr:hypothetical protein [Trifolium medium]
MGRDILESECSRLSDVGQSGVNLSNRLRELLEEELLDRVFVVGTSPRLEQHGILGSEVMKWETSIRRTNNGLEEKFLFGEHFGGKYGMIVPEDSE